MKTLKNLSIMASAFIALVTISLLVFANHDDHEGEHHE